MKRLCILLVMAVSILVTGCFPHERIWWSPDGSHAAVVLADGLHLIKPGDAPGTPVVPAAREDVDLPTGLTWLPDGSGFVMARTRSFATWEQARDHIPVEEVAEVERLSLGVPGWVEALMASGAKAKNADELVSGSPLAKSGIHAAAFLCAYERKQQLIDAMLKRSLAGQELVAALHDEKRTQTVHEISLVDLKQAAGGKSEPRPLVRSLRPFMIPQVSPHHAQVAFLRMMDGDEDAALELCPLKGGASVAIAQQVGASFAWSPDGRSLIHTSSFSGKDNVVRRLQSVKVLNETGDLADEEVRGKITDLAVAVMPTPARVQCLPDGRVMFAALPVTLPMVGDGPEAEPQLYTVTPDGKTLTMIKAEPGSLPADLRYFVASPDGKRLAVVESGTDAVAVLELETGKSHLVSPAHPDWQCRTLPAWKSSTELTYAALAGDSKTPRWMMWTVNGAVRSLSEAWPADTTETWLELRKHDKPGPTPDTKTP